MRHEADHFLQRCVAWLEANETMGVAVFALLLLGFNLCSAKLYPTSWNDEVMFADPAINFVQGKGFTSTAWFQSKELTWSGNVPLYTSALIPWIKSFGQGLVQVRAFNYTLASLALFIFWLGVKRQNWIRSVPARIGMVVAAFLSFPLCFVYRSVRPDCLSLLICAGALLAWSWKSHYAKYTCLFLAGLLSPVSGLQLVPYLGLLCLLVFLLEGIKPLVPLAVLMAGMVSGGLALFSFYQAHHLTGVLETIRQTRIYHQTAELAGSQGEPTLFLKLLQKVRTIFHEQLSDFGILPALAALAILAGDRRIWSDKRLRFLVGLGFLGSFAIGAALEILIHYPVYYHWMSYLILMIVVFAVLSETWDSLGRFRKTLVLLLFAGSVLAGLPLRVVLGQALNQRREYAQLKHMIQQQIRSTDVIFCDYTGYFPVKVKAAELYSPRYLNVMTETERQSVNVLVLNMVNSGGDYKKFAGNDSRWKQVAKTSSEPTLMRKLVTRLLPRYNQQDVAYGYCVTIFRRDP